MIGRQCSKSRVLAAQHGTTSGGVGAQPSRLLRDEVSGRFAPKSHRSGKTALDFVRHMGSIPNSAVKENTTGRDHTGRKRFRDATPTSTSGELAGDLSGPGCFGHLAAAQAARGGRCHTVSLPETVLPVAVAVAGSQLAEPGPAVWIRIRRVHRRRLTTPAAVHPKLNLPQRPLRRDF